MMRCRTGGESCYGWTVDTSEEKDESWAGSNLGVDEVQIR